MDWLLTHLKEMSRFQKSGTALCQKTGETQTFYWRKMLFAKKRTREGRVPPRPKPKQKRGKAEFAPPARRLAKRVI
ncbi:MAG: hypothetical protein ACI8QI_001444 [Limisphaerales bacterium]